MLCGWFKNTDEQATDEENYAGAGLNGNPYVTRETIADRIKCYYEYDAFGNVIEAEESIENRFRFAGEQHDPVTEQYYLRARYYNPVIGRFMQEDTYHGDGLNLYAYVGNNPVRYVDPSGHCKVNGVTSDGVSRSILSDYLRIDEENIFGSFYSVKNKQGGDVYVSVGEISANDFAELVEDANGRTRVNIISGIHGDEFGNVYVEEQFYFDDVRDFQNPNVSVFNYAGMNFEEISNVVNSTDLTICAWCFSERNPVIRMALQVGKK